MIEDYTHAGCEALIRQGLEVVLAHVAALPDPERRTASLQLLEYAIEMAERMVIRFPALETG